MNILAAFNDPMDLLAVIFISVIGVSLLAWLETSTARHTRSLQPTSGPNAFQSCK